jgi:hypothetical protein
MTKTSLVLGFVHYVKQHTTNHKQGLGFTKIQWSDNNYTLIGEGFQFPPNFMHIPFLSKITCPNSQGYGANLDTQYIFSNSQANFFLACQNFQLVREITSNLSSTF